jgi:urease accessory protein
MYDGASLSDPVQRQRAAGELHVGVRRLGAETMLEDLRQSGCLRARFPRRQSAGWIDVVTLNTGGGVAGGDRLDLAFSVGPGAQAVIAAQAAERFYRTAEGDAASFVRTRIAVAEGAALEWLPQETILFDRFALDRRLEIDLAGDARFLCVETLVFGRAAMGETVRQGSLRDLLRVRRDGGLLLHDAIRLDGAVDAILSRPATAAGAHVVSTLLLISPDAERMLECVRSAVDGADAGVSAWNGMLVARVLGTDSATVRRVVTGALAALRGPRPLPRVWLC